MHVSTIMPVYDKTRLWQTCLSANVGDPHAAPREQLRVAYEKFRERAVPLSEAIAKDLPDFTVHDVTHLDALWEYADLISGPEYLLTPCEAFVLGGAFLVHDLGMGLAAYPEGLSELKRLTIWKDIAISILRKSGHEDAGPDDLSNMEPSLEREVTSEVLRLRHAERAAELALTTWQDQSGTVFHLIDDPELRASFGPLIGRIAHSHWWSIDELDREFNAIVGAPGGFPSAWQVDPLKLACIIRAADFCHLDDRRAPSFVMAFRRPASESLAHWQFQNKLYQPRLEGDRLIYTAKSSFPLAEAAAWWLCFDTLVDLSSELWRVDSLLADTSRQRLAAKGVAHTEDPARMSKIIRTEGWLPVDTRIQVSAVAKLVRMLGGQELYGDEVVPPLRELMQNGADAIRARRTLENRPEDWGTLKVSTGSDDLGHWVEVEDNGVGMSQAVLTKYLLDFGSSFWTSDLAHSELPGLNSSGFRAVGKFGIGFFSVFMWGERVRVVTRRFDAAKSDASILEFTDGLNKRPLLMPSTLSDALLDGGTRVRVWLRDKSILESLLRSDRARGLRLKDACVQLAPCLDVNLVTKEDGQPPESALSALDWKHIDDDALLHRIENHKWGVIGHEEETESFGFRPKLTMISDKKGRCYGRAAIWKTPRELLSDATPGCITVGGLSTTTLNGVCGVLFGQPTTAARDHGIPSMPLDVTQQWAHEEGMRRLEEGHPPVILSTIAEVLRPFGTDLGRYPIARTKDGWITMGELKGIARAHDEIYIVQDAAYEIILREQEDFVLLDKVVVVAMGYSRLGLNRMSRRRDSPEWPAIPVSNCWLTVPFHMCTLFGAAIEAIADGWSCDVQSLVAGSEGFDRMSPRPKRQIGTAKAGSVPIEESAVVVFRPAPLP